MTHMGSVASAFGLVLLVSSVVEGSSLMKNFFVQEDAEVNPRICPEASACGYVQLNGRGVSSYQTCECGNQRACPLNWDPFDGKTVVHGNDQYKYCEESPVLSRCAEGQLAHTSVTQESVTDPASMISFSKIHCICPGHFMFQLNDTAFDTIGNMEVMSIKYICARPPTCKAEEYCMGSTISAESSFITKKCVCPRGSYCPKDLRMATMKMETKKGFIYNTQCQF